MTRWILIIYILLTNCAYSQVYSSNKKDFIRAALSDTGMGNGYYFAMKVKLRGGDSIKIYSGFTESLFYYFNKEYKWSGEKFIKEISKYLLTDKPYIIEKRDEYFFPFHSLTPLSKCDCTLELDSMVISFNNLPLNAPKACLIYNLFKKNVLTGRSENHVSIIKRPVVGSDTDNR